MSHAVPRLYGFVLGAVRPACIVRSRPGRRPVGVEGRQRPRRVLGSAATFDRQVGQDRAAAGQPPDCAARLGCRQRAGQAAIGQRYAGGGPPPAQKSTAEREMEFRKRQQERADAEKKANEEQARAAAKSSECERAKTYLRALEEGHRVVRTDAAGNLEHLDDAQRASEVERTRKMMQSTCG